jgi:hypothetical protein
MGWLGILAAVGNSRLGNILLALVVGMGLGWWNTEASWRSWEKDQEKIRSYNQQVELSREANNAVEIAKAATQRAEDDAAAMADLQRQIAEFDKGEKDAKDPCLIDDRFRDAAGKLRQPAPRDRHTPLARPAKPLR